MTLRRIRVKNALVTDLIEDRRSLAQVTAHFLILNEPDGVCMSVVRKSFPGRTDFETTAHYVLNFVEGRLATATSADRDRVNLRLALQLADAIDADGFPTDPPVRELFTPDSP